MQDWVFQVAQLFATAWEPQEDLAATPSWAFDSAAEAEWKCQGNRGKRRLQTQCALSTRQTLDPIATVLSPMPFDCFTTSNVATASDNGWNGRSNAIILATIQRISFKFSVGKP